MNHTPVRLVVAALLTVPAGAQICRLQELTWPDPQADARVGGSVALHGDTLAAGGIQVDMATSPGGAVYVWRQQGGTWALEQKIPSPAPTGFNTTFGRHLALAGDRLVVSANPTANTVWLLRRSGTQWTSSGELAGATAQYAAYYGHAIANDGEWIAVGAPQTWVPPSVVRTGAVSLFRDQGGVVTEVAVLQPPWAALHDEIGIALAMRGGVLVVGTAVGNSSASASLGRAVVYRIVSDQPVLEQELPVVSASPGYQSSALIGTGATFGQVVATDGVRIAVGDRLAVQGSSSVGRVDIWVHQNGSWVHEGFVIAPPNAQGFLDRLALEGDDLVVTQTGGDRVHHFRRVGGVWTTQHVTPVMPSSVFRTAGIAMEGGLLALGSALSLAPLANAGRVAVHELGAGSWPYGAGIAGSGGLVPKLAGNGRPRIGQPFSIDLTNGLGGAVAVLGAGSTPWQTSMLGGFVWFTPIVATAVLPLSGSSGVAGDGAFQFTLSLPSPSLVGASACFQAAVLDPATPQGVAWSNAVEVVVGS